MVRPTACRHSATATTFAAGTHGRRARSANEGRLERRLLTSDRRQHDERAQHHATNRTLHSLGPTDRA